VDRYDQFASAKAVFDQADQALGLAISRLCFEGPEDELRQTVNTQPAVVTVSLACLKALEEVNPADVLPSPAYVAGHSLGEYSALAATGVLDLAEAIYLARERGRLMHEAGLKNPGGMVAVIGLSQPLLADICQQTDTRIANINCPGQLVISGEKEKLDKATELAMAKGAYRVIPLAVSGAFHTPLMQPAVDGMAEVIAKLSFSDPATPIIGNTTAQPLTSAEAVKEELLNQLCNPIDWQSSIQYMLNKGVSTFIEIGPGKVLSGLIKRIDKKAQTLNLGDAETIKNIKTALVQSEE
jgi:[acyl-carrier-protein] S-malonyltransferase